MTWCTTRTDRARVCLLIDLAREPIPGIWIGIPHEKSSFYVKVEYETLPTFCGKCHSQGHNRKNCKWKDDNNCDGHNSKKTRDMNLKVWVPKTIAKENQDGAVLENIEGPQDVSASKKKS